jgi:hypothetical protein
MLFYSVAVNGPSHPKKLDGPAGEPRRCAGCGERGWRAAGRSNAGRPAPQPSGHTADRACAAAEPASRGAVAEACCQPFHAQDSYSRWQAQLRGKVACTIGCRSATVIVSCHHHVPHAAAATHAPPMPNATAWPGHRKRSASTACDACQRSAVSVDRHGLNHVRRWGGVGWGPPTPTLPLPTPSRLGPAVAEPILHALCITLCHTPCTHYATNPHTRGPATLSLCCVVSGSADVRAGVA